MDTTPSQRRLVRAAFASAKRAHALSLRRRGATLAEIGAELGVCREQARQAVLKAERLIERPHWSDALPTRARRFLRDHDLADLPEAKAAEVVARFTLRDLKAEPNLGKGAIGALSAWLIGHGLALRAEIPTANKKGAPVRGRPCDSHSPLAAGRKVSGTCKIAAIGP
jgi:hypothetical protein